LRDYSNAQWRENRRNDEVRVEPDVVARFVSQRVLDLGWSHARFGTVDKWLGQRRDRSAAPVERLAKKYARIGLYEALGRIADHSLVKRPYGSFDSVAYEGPWQVGYSPDIDPSHVFVDPATSGKTGDVGRSGGSRRFTRFTAPVMTLLGFEMSTTCPTSDPCSSGAIQTAASGWRSSHMQTGSAARIGPTLV
jgi:hypothetical protein